MFARKTLIAAVLFALPFSAYAQSADVNYCKALIAKYREYNKQGDPNASIAMAIGSCDTDTKGSIATLEQALNDQKVALPPRN